MNLVLHGRALPDPELRRIVQMVSGGGVTSLGPVAVRISRAEESPLVATYCEQNELDFAWVPETRLLSNLRLIAMDMDSTLVTIESIDEMGGLLGIKDRIASVTEQAMRGEIDYRESLQRRVALLAGLESSALERICEERMQLSPGAEALISRCRELGIRTLLVSGGFSFFTGWLKERLGLDAAYSNQLEIVAGKLTGRMVGDIVDGEGKAARLVQEIASMGIMASQVVAVGDGANDVPMMNIAGVSVAYRAKPVVKDKATHALDYCGLDEVLNLYA
ncbi:MAG: phosphoserine phosphatase SerB [Proteobacteria bacterium]|nr:phosphoserine phosphatase SerB [Pseudomonadota bacterium]MDA0982758.1 phosphoserine phosphatase SerB [Pseudomonadota bacterium]